MDYFDHAVDLTKEHARLAVSRYRQTQPDLVTWQMPKTVWLLWVENSVIGIYETLTVATPDVLRQIYEKQTERWTLTSDLRWVSNLGRVMRIEQRVIG